MIPERRRVPGGGTGAVELVAFEFQLLQPKLFHFRHHVQISSRLAHE